MQFCSPIISINKKNKFMSAFLIYICYNVLEKKERDFYMKEKIIILLENSIKELGITDDNIVLEIPKNKDNGDYSTNIALKNCKKINMNPIELAQKITDNINDEDIQDIKIASPGFINFYLNMF